MNGKLWEVESFRKYKLSICLNNDNVLIICSDNFLEPPLTKASQDSLLVRGKRFIMDAISIGMSIAALGLSAANTVRINQLEKNNDILIHSMKLLNEREDSVSNSLELLQTNDNILFTKRKQLSKGVETISRDLCTF